MTVALIPARGGSKRLPRKNLCLFAGRPLLFYSIALAQAVKQIDRCVVSTEDREIADVARGYGAEVIDRPPALADDLTSTASVAAHALRTLELDSRTPDVLVLFQPNCPLRPKSLVVRALDLLDDTADSVVSVTPHHRKAGNIQNGLFVPDYRPGIRSQDMPTRYFENGLVYVTWARTVLEQGSLFGRRIRPVVTEPLYAMGDIDTALDLAVAEFLFETHRNHFE